MDGIDGIKEKTKQIIGKQKHSVIGRIGEEGTEGRPRSPFGKEGVMAKRSAMNRAREDYKRGAKAIQDASIATGKEYMENAMRMQQSAKRMVEDGRKKMESSITTFQDEVEDGRKKMESGIKTFQDEMKATTDDFKAYTKEFYFG
jgi:chromosome condensin MukBEF ATPase and DNA-binding subunit MukB